MGEHRGSSCAGGSSTKSGDKKKIQAHIGGNGQRQKAESRPRVANGPQDSGKQIVKVGKRESGQNDRQISRRVGNQFIRCTNQFKDDRQQAHGDHTNHQSQGRTESQRHEHFLTEFFVVTGSVNLTQDDCHAHTETIQNKNKEIHDRSGQADRRKSICAEKMADDQGVSSVVELLKNIAEQQWDCQCYQLFFYVSG